MEEREKSGSKPVRRNLIDRAIEFVAPVAGAKRMAARMAIHNFSYAAAHPDNSRGSSGGMAQNANPESPLIQRERVALMWDARNLECNVPVTACVLDRLAQYAFGTLLFRPDTGDTGLNTELQRYLEYWMDNEADFSQRHDFRTLVELTLRSFLRDGDVGVNKVRGEYLGLQLIEADRIGDPQRAGSNDGDNYTAGLHIDPGTGRVLAYDIYDRDKANRYKKAGEPVPADQFTHLYRPTRADQYRGVTFFAPVIPQIYDLYETFKMERGAAKWAASFAGVIRVADRFRSPGTTPVNWDGKKPDGTPTQEVKPNTLVKLKDHEDVVPFPPSNRPSGAFIDLIQSELKDIAMGLNIPYGFLDMAGFSGANSRLETEQVQRTIARYQKIVLVKLLRPTARDVINQAIASTHILMPQKRELRQRLYDHDWRFGRHITADVGYSMQSDVLALNNGLTTGSALTEQLGEDFEDNINKLAEEAAIIRNAAETAGVPVEMLLSSRFPDASQMLASYEASKRPPPPPSIETVGDKGTAQIIEILEKVATGVMPRQHAINTLITVYNVPPPMAQRITPPQGSGQAPEESRGGKSDSKSKKK